MRSPPTLPPPPPKKKLEHAQRVNVYVLVFNFRTLTKNVLIFNSYVGEGFLISQIADFFMLM